MIKSAIMFGAGNVGRGFLGQLFSESGYEVEFVDIDNAIIQSINDKNRYTIRLVNNDWVDEVIVSPVRALHSQNTDQVAEAMSWADIGATAVGARVLPHIAPLVAQGVERRRLVNPQKPLNIIICENLKGAAKIFKEMVAGYLSSESKSYFENHIGFVDTVIGRMIPPLVDELRKKDPSLIIVEPYKELPVDKAGFIGEIPKIVGMEVCDNFPSYTARKLYIHNCGHAILAYFGYLRGHDYGYQALEDILIRKVFDGGLAESSAGIVNYYGVEPEWVQNHIIELTQRFANRALGDTILRLARDPIRKLASTDRLVGAAKMCMEVNIIPEYLSWAIGAGFCYADPQDPIALELQEIIRSKGIEYALSTVSDLQSGEMLTNMVLDKYKRLQAGEMP